MLFKHEVVSNCCKLFAKLVQRINLIGAEIALSNITVINGLVPLKVATLEKYYCMQIIIIVNRGNFY